jgi:hypothetical protein
MGKNDLIRVNFYYKDHPQTKLSVFLQSEQQVQEYKKKHPNVVYLEESPNV